MEQTVLVVDDDPEVREPLAEALEDLGFAVARAGDGVEALEALAQLPRPAVILLDITMPRMDGLTMLKQLRSAGATDPVIILTGTQVLSRDSVEAWGAQDFVIKPLELDELLRKVRAVSGA